MVDRELEADRHELPRPQRAIGIGHASLEQYRTGRAIDRVVDEGERSRDLFRAITDVGDEAHRQRFVEARATSHLFERLLGHGETRQHGLQFVDGDQRWIGLGAHEASHAERDLSGAPGNRRSDRRALEIEPRPLQGGLPGCHGSGEGRRLSEGLIELLAGHVAILGQLGEAHRVAAGADQRGLVAGERALEPIKFGAKWPRIDLEEHLSLADFIALSDRQPGKHPGHE